jgi:glutamine amidotransferase
MPKVAVINYGVGNLRSLQRGLEKSGAEVLITDNPSDLAKSDAVVLPGVGAFAEAIKNLSPLSEALLRSVREGKPLLGICLGLQLLFTKSYEGGLTNGFNLLQGEVVKLPDTVKTPHIGWNTIQIAKSNPLVENVQNNSFMYFVHTYFPKPTEQRGVVAYTEYGVKFPSIIAKKHLFTTQFHPEKSSKPGLAILKNFVKIVER